MTDEQWIVHVHDAVDVRIAGHDGAAYTSPPQTRDAALALVALLVGPTSPDDERRPLDARDRRRPPHRRRSKPAP